ncbi:TlpA disulfide reductase family protein [Oscillospiraceae bacterium PP1C4]
MFYKKTLAIAMALMLTACSANGGTSSSEAASSSQSTAESASSMQESNQPSLSKFTATDLEGNEVSQEIFADADLTMINIWATFCGPCLSEMPELGEISAEYKDRGVKVVGIVMDVLNSDGTISEEMVKTAKETVEKTGAAYQHLLPSDDLIAAKLKEVSAVPETFFVDKNGNIVGKSYMGAKSKDKWIAIIEETLKEVK